MQQLKANAPQQLQPHRAFRCRSSFRLRAISTKTEERTDQGELVVERVATEGATRAGASKVRV
jgi:hypothetical protein